MDHHGRYMDMDDMAVDSVDAPHCSTLPHHPISCTLRARPEGGTQRRQLLRSDRCLRTGAATTAGHGPLEADAGGKCAAHIGILAVKNWRSVPKIGTYWNAEGGTLATHGNTSLTRGIMWRLVAIAVFFCAVLPSMCREYFKYFAHGKQ